MLFCRIHSGRIGLSVSYYYRLAKKPMSLYLNDYIHIFTMAATNLNDFLHTTSICFTHVC